MYVQVDNGETDTLPGKGDYNAMVFINKLGLYTAGEVIINYIIYFIITV